MKLEIKHLAPYLPFNIKVQWVREDDKELIIQYLTISDYNFLIRRKYAKPILRPLSDLTKSIEVNGERFVPAYKMITHGFHNQFWYETEIFDYRYLYAMDLEKLFEWHFDVFGLIEKGLAISYNDLK